jgi:exodeoxyribonuclease V beta subunit
VTPFDALTVPLGGTHLIEASAGTGKTYAITNLYVRLLLERQLAVSQILVVTYTNAATAELRARIRRRIRETLLAFEAGDAHPLPEGEGTLLPPLPVGEGWGEGRGGSDDEFLGRLVRRRREAGALAHDRTRLVVALHGFDEAAIFTIHGFCQRMLQDNAFESGVAFDTELVTNETPLLTEVVQDFWVRELHTAPAAFVSSLADGGITPASLAQLATTVSTHPDMPVLPERADAVLQAAESPPEQAYAAQALALQLDCVAYARRELRRRKEQARVQSFDDLLQRLAEALRGPGGPGLAAAMRARFRAALIDEFQDTDPVQYEIFRRVYLNRDVALFLIGDPKQAIYAFRGADVFAYMQAKRDVGGHPHTLGINWRSDPSLIAGVSALFGRLRAPFVFEAIPFIPVAAAAAARDSLGGSYAGQAPLRILFVRRTGQESRDRAINKPWGEGVLTGAVAADIVQLLESGATIGERRVVAGDIAVLCRKNKQAAAMQVALRALGVPSVLRGDASVFEASEAEEVERVLRALADPGDGRAIRAALATTLLGQTAQDLVAVERDEQRWDEWVRQFHAWHERWTQRGFVAAWRALLDEPAPRDPSGRGLAARLLGFVDGERRLTNVLHLMELLHTASTEERRGPQALVQWLHEMRTNASARAALAGEAEQIRLESDEAAVQLTTVHKSKGLEYAIVYCPFLWDGALLSEADTQAPRFHDHADGDRLTLDIGSSDFDAHLALAKHEAFAEQVRLLYVALTRARHRCTVVWGAFRSAADSALGYVLHQPPGGGGDPRPATAARIRSFIGSGDDAGMRADLDALAATVPGCIAVTDLSLQPGGRDATPSEAALDLRCRAVTREVQRTWRVSSFSQLASSGGPLSPPAEEGVDHDAAAEPAVGDTAAAPPSASRIVLHDFPAGARAGQLVHEVLETVDFQNTDPGVLQHAVAAALARFGFDDAWAAPLCRAVADVVATPLVGGEAAFSLRDVPRSHRLSELEFLFPVGDSHAMRSPGVMLTRERLAAAFARHAQAPVPADYASRVRDLGFTPFAGFLKGFVDLAFAHAGRWYLADYKSNLLGVYADDYRPARLGTAMTAHHYFLQYHLYLVALHRHLARRVPGYDYDRHVGGVFYLFVRGMSPAHARGTGIFVDRPSRQLIEALSAVLAGRHEAER